MKTFMIVAMSIFLIAILGITAGLVIAFRKQTKDAAGKLCFGKTDVDGIVFGAQGKQLCYSPSKSEEHSIILGRSGSGKTSAILIPTLRAFQGHCLVIDISGDILKNCQNRIKRVVFSPDNRDGSSAVYNIFGEIDELPEEERDEALERLAQMLIPVRDDKDKNDFFTMGAIALLSAALICGYHLGMDFIPSLEMVLSPQLGKIVQSSGNRYAERCMKQFGGIKPETQAACRQNAIQAISLFLNNENMRKLIHRPELGEEELNAKSIEDGDVFLRIPDSKLAYYAPLVRLFMGQTFSYLLTRPEDKKETILLALDELCSFGWIDIVQPMQKLRKFHVRVLLLAQSLADMDLVYGREARESVLNNAAYKCNLGVTDRTTQLYFADQAGRYTPDDDIPSAWETFLPERGPRKNRAGSYRVPPEELAYMGENVFLLHPDGYTWLKKHYYYKT